MVFGRALRPAVAGAAIAIALLPHLCGADEFVTIGTGGVTGVYYPTGGAICRVVNKGREQHGVRCSVESTGGSAYNIKAIRDGDLHMGVAQSDVQYNAYHGKGQFALGGAFVQLRALFSVHAEPVTIIARSDSGVTHVDHLVGKRVNIGNPGSGQLATWEVMWSAMGRRNEDLALAARLKSAETPQALCDNEIDAFFWLVGHPNGLSKEATTACEAVMVEVSGPAIARLVADNPYYRFATIPAGMYRGNPQETPTFGVGATFVSSTRISADTVYHVVRSVFENFDDFRKLHPAFNHLKQHEMINDGLSAPLHEGAERYYKERGWR